MNRAAEVIGLKWAHERNIMGQGIGVAVLDTGDRVIIMLR